MGAPILNANQLGGETQAQALEIYRQIQLTTQADLDPFDLECGTWNAEAFHNSGQCSDKHFLCGAEENRHFEQCLEAIDCQMHHDMAVKVPSTSTSKFATFARQMIPHHQNAVSMAKALLKFHEAKDYPAPTEDDDFPIHFGEDLAWHIINVQNRQIQQMSAWLESNPTKSGESNKCYEASDDDGLSAGVLAGIIVGSVLGLALLTGAGLMMMRKQKKTVAPAK